MIDLAHSTGRIEARLDEHSRRLKAIEVKLERRPRVEAKDLLPYLYGAVILMAAVAGKVTWPEALTLLGSGK